MVSKRYKTTYPPERIQQTQLREKDICLGRKKSNLLAIGKDNNEHRVVITLESIVDVVKAMHIQINHLGWGATWRDVSSAYYGILRSDVIFLLKRCYVCAHDPSKRAKNPRNDESLEGQVGQKAFKE